MEEGLQLAATARDGLRVAADRLLVAANSAAQFSMSQAQQEHLRQLAASESTAAQLRRELEAAESALQAARGRGERA